MYIEQALKYKHDFWRYLVGFLVVFIGSQVIGIIPIGIAIAVKAMLGNGMDFSSDTAIYQSFEPNILLLYLLVPFVVGMVLLYIWMKPMHGQPFKTLHSSKQKLDKKKIAFSFLVWGGFSAALILVDYFFLSPDDYVWNFKLVPFVIMILIAVILIPIQTSFEEYLFRGYLMQGIGAAAKNKWVPLVTTSVIFGLMHIFNPEIDKIGYIALVAYIGSGFLLGIMTLMDDGLELALGFHAANNLVAAILVTADWTAFQTHSMLKDISEPAAGADVFIPVLVIYPILLFVFSKKYGWKNWREKLTGPVLASNIDNE